MAEEARRELTAGKIKSLMGVSDAIATLNVGRFEAFEGAETKPCALAFDGPAFKHLNADGLETEEETTYLQTHLRVLSGMYGVLRPYDAIAPYRMEMGTRWAPGAPKDRLYEYWGTDIANCIADDVEAQAESTQTKPFVLNCASQEYWKSVKSDVLEKRGIPVYTASFPGPAVYAKQARGAMVRHCIDAGVSSPQDLKTFVGTDGSWSYDGKASSEFNFVFTRGAKRRRVAIKEKPEVRLQRERDHPKRRSGLEIIESIRSFRDAIVASTLGTRFSESAPPSRPALCFPSRVNRVVHCVVTRRPRERIPTEPDPTRKRQTLDRIRSTRSTLADEARTNERLGSYGCWTEHDVFR